MNDLDTINLLRVNFTNTTLEEVLEFITKGLEKPQKKYYIVTPNPELLVIANRNNRYKSILNGAKLALPDGIGVIKASKLLSKPLKQRITGVDLVENLCRYISKKPVTAAFLGAGPHIAEQAAECLQKKYPGLRVAWTSQEWESDLNHKQVDILFVAFGSPKQEIWIAEHLEKLPVKVAVGVGGAFDFLSGNTKRAPKLWQDLGLEWLYRLVREPWRIKRQIWLIYFVYLVIKEKIIGK